MAKAKKIGGLGRGLTALIPQIAEDDTQVAGESPEQNIRLDIISTNPYQPRRVFDEEKIHELSLSIREHGVVQPVLVRPFGDGYQLVAGERRIRAARQAGLRDIPALVRELTDHEMMEISLIENIQRQDLDPIEEARAYKRLAEEFGLTQEQIAVRVSKSRPYIANSIRLLQLPEEILECLAKGALTPGHVRPLLTLDDETAIRLAKRLIEENGTARHAELWAKERLVQEGDDQEKRFPSKPGGEIDRKSIPLQPELKEIQRLLRNAVQTKVEITQGAKGGKIVIEYYTQDDIERVLELLTGSGSIG